MITLFQSNQTYQLSEIKDAVTNQVKQLPAMVSSIGHCKNILRYEFACEPVNILGWLHNNLTPTKIYWSGREGDTEVGGTGIADGIKGLGAVDYEEIFEYIDNRFSYDNPNLKYYGGFCFDDTALEGPWKEFGTYQFIVPQFEFNRTGDKTVFAFNILIDKIDQDNINNLLEQLEQMDFAPDTQYRKVPRILERKDVPDRKKWAAIFEQSRQRHLEKIVLARQSTFDFNVALRSDALLKHLKDRTPDCFHFDFQFSTNMAFIGATPERLFKICRGTARRAPTILTEAIAGTRPRAKDERQDAALADELLASEKDAREHHYVVDAIERSLMPLCEQVDRDQAFQLRKLKGSQHLITPFHGTLKETVRNQDILKSMHPTPAIAGTPTSRAVEAIRELEPFNRGWYTGPVGYIGKDQTEFAVAIRCGLIHGNHLSLYAGAGIVDGSTVEGEWDEIENKISNFMRVFEK